MIRGLTTKLARAIPIMSLFVAISRPWSDFAVKSDAIVAGSSTQFPLTIENNVFPEVILKSSSG